MDDFLEKVKEQASKAKTGATKFGKQVYEKTNTAIALTKLSIAVSETDSKIKEIYETIGRHAYNKYLSDGKICDFALESCEALDELFKEKDALKEKKAELKESIRCSECGSYNKNDSAYCSKCGTKLGSDEQEEEVSCEEDAEPEEDEEETEPEDDREAEETTETVEIDYEPEESESVIKKVKKVITIKAKKPVED